MCYCIICGLTKITRKINTPSGYDAPIDNLNCPFCGFRGKPVYRRKDYFYSLFFIPLCPVSKGTPYLSCKSCGEIYGFGNVNYCDSCRTVAPSGYVFCSHCGKSTV